MKKLLITSICAVLVLPAPALADGRADYNAYCAGCHGAKGYVPTEKAKALGMDVRKLALKASKMNNDDMTTIIKKGKGKMPSFEKQLTKAQISAVIDYVVALRKK